MVVKTDRYLEYSKYTDPGQYDYLYEDLPDDIYKLNRIIKSQLIHPIADFQYYRDVIPEHRRFEDRNYPTVFSILEGLMHYDNRGLTKQRNPEHRLVLSCRYHALLLASILKFKKIPARVRFGFVPYLQPGFMIAHIITEVWLELLQKWIRVDPDRKITDLHKKDFETSSSLWTCCRTGEFDAGELERYGVENTWGFYAILDSLCHDFQCVLGSELTYWECPPVCADPECGPEDIPEERLEILDRLALLLENPDRNLDLLETMHSEYSFLRYE